MKVSIRDLGVTMDLGNKGVEFRVYDAEWKQIGDFYVGKKHLIWCKGKVRRENGNKVTWTKFIEWVESQ